MGKKADKVQEYGAFRRWLHKGKIFRGACWVGQVVAQAFVVMISAQFCIEYLIPAFASLYAQGMGLSPDIDNISLVAVWGLPMLFLTAIVFIGELALIRAVWRLFGRWFGTLRDNRTRELEERFSSASDKPRVREGR